MSQEPRTNPVECPRSLVVERVFPHPPEKLWRALTEGPLLAQWMMNNDFEPVVGRKFQFRAEAQNVFNHPNLSNPNSDMKGGWDPSDPTTWGDFGTVTSTQKNSSGSSGRVLQIAGKIVF